MKDELFRELLRHRSPRENGRFHLQNVSFRGRPKNATAIHADNGGLWNPLTYCWRMRAPPQPPQPNRPVRTRKKKKKKCTKRYKKKPASLTMRKNLQIRMCQSDSAGSGARAHIYEEERESVKHKSWQVNNKLSGPKYTL